MNYIKRFFRNTFYLFMKKKGKKSDKKSKDKNAKHSQPPDSMYPLW